MKIISQYVSMNKRWLMTKSNSQCKLCKSNNDVYTITISGLINENSIELCSECIDSINNLNNKRDDNE